MAGLGDVALDDLGAPAEAFDLGRDRLETIRRRAARTRFMPAAAQARAVAAPMPEEAPVTTIVVSGSFATGWRVVRRFRGRRTADGAAD